MKIKRNQLLIVILVAGFLIGFYYAWKIKLRLRVFDEATIESWKSHGIVYKDYLLFLAKERLAGLLLIVFLGQVKYTHIYGGIVVFCSGISGGALLAASGMQMGFKGCFGCLISLFPQICFYGMAYYILIQCWMWKTRWTKIKILGIIVFVGLGILSEAYISPLFVKMFW